MNQEIRQKLRKIRDFCAADKRSRTIVRLNPGAVGAVARTLGATQYFEFLSESNGARFGIIDIFNLSLIEGSQSITTDADVHPAIGVGQVLYEPLLVRSDNGEVVIPIVSLGQAPRAYPDFDDFINDAALGPGYAALCSGASDDRWYQALISFGFIEGT